VIATASVSADETLVSLLGNSFTADRSGFARMPSDIVLDGLVVERCRRDLLQVPVVTACSRR
jgi:hypothetical protein